MKVVRSQISVYDEINPKAIMKKLEYCARKCYQSEPGNGEALIRTCIKKGHTSILEHVGFTFDITTDVGVLGEITRHRHASFSVESTRYCKYADGSMWFIDPIEMETGSEELQYWALACMDSELEYNRILSKTKMAQTARSTTNKSLKCNMVMTFNLRSMRNLFTLRAAKPAHPHFKEIAIPWLLWMKRLLPVVFEDIGYDEEFYQQHKERLDAIVVELGTPLEDVTEKRVPFVNNQEMIDHLEENARRVESFCMISSLLEIRKSYSAANDPFHKLRRWVQDYSGMIHTCEPLYNSEITGNNGWMNLYTKLYKQGDGPRAMCIQSVPNTTGIFSFIDAAGNIVGEGTIDVETLGEVHAVVQNIVENFDISTIYVNTCGTGKVFYEILSEHPVITTNGNPVELAEIHVTRAYHNNAYQKLYDILTADAENGAPRGLHCLTNAVLNTLNAAMVDSIDFGLSEAYAFLQYERSKKTGNVPYEN